MDKINMISSDTMFWATNHQYTNIMVQKFSKSKQKCEVMIISTEYMLTIHADLKTIAEFLQIQTGFTSVHIVSFLV